MSIVKAKLYKTAIALISCSHFREGDFVSVKYDSTDESGTHYFLVNGKVIYPEHHLTSFVL